MPTQRVSLGTGTGPRIAGEFPRNPSQTLATPCSSFQASCKLLQAIANPGGTLAPCYVQVTSWLLRVARLWERACPATSSAALVPRYSIRQLHTCKRTHTRQSHTYVRANMICTLCVCMCVCVAQDFEDTSAPGLRPDVRSFVRLKDTDTLQDTVKFMSDAQQQSEGDAGPLGTQSNPLPLWVAVQVHDTHTHIHTHTQTWHPDVCMQQQTYMHEFVCTKVRVQMGLIQRICMVVVMPHRRMAQVCSRQPAATPHVAQPPVQSSTVFGAPV